MGFVLCSPAPVSMSFGFEAGATNHAYAPTSEPGRAIELGTRCETRTAFRWSSGRWPGGAHRCVMTCHVHRRRDESVRVGRRTHLEPGRCSSPRAAEFGLAKL